MGSGTSGRSAVVGASSGVTSLACIFDDDEDCAVEGCGCVCHGVICYVRGFAHPGTV